MPWKFSTSAATSAFLWGTRTSRTFPLRVTVVADNLLRQSLGRIANDPPLLRVCEDPQQYSEIDNPDAA